MTKRVLSVGQCVPDTQSLRNFLQSTFDVEMVPAATGPEALDLLRKSAYDLVLVNRKLDIDYSDGMDVLRSIKADEQLGKTPVMLITNYPEYQENAVMAGEPGFGKDQLGHPDAIARLEPFLHS